MTPVESRRRAIAYCNIDGVGELGVGFMLASAGAFAWAELHLPENSVWTSSWAAWVWLALTVGIIQAGSEAIKKRITYPRTGFVAHRMKDFWRWGIAAGFAGGLLASGLNLARHRHWDLTMLPAIAGPIMAVLYGYGFARGAAWKWAVAAAMAGGSIVAALLPEDVTVALVNGRQFPGLPVTVLGTMLAAEAWLGALALISGGISLAQYVRHTPEAGEGL